MGLFTEGEAGPRGLVPRCLPAASGHGGSPRLACPVPFRRVGPGPPMRRHLVRPRPDPLPGRGRSRGPARAARPFHSVPARGRFCFH